ncbi:hypothetical protein VOLCADRAFT_116195 [Volvox carteri f. nagariensis]|uniref:Uncharacterized protein n=1 Tax=Volvox carteri f. nagariensis TaxID=3068 RepID=D8TJZ7_VOLCA|nr:uncharacterized protein VOLCADRAFT_116195 [Volvox carteri f. nagariensis]EFJ52158.1 hypothetical protein VOLCADRAFT_116195 [Volvox carteri f. nagariensis]|eukprot:XP_002946932.1 hypothetical protein VOLCADRAFT_116195 [Volvox carteri f. nagariensis]
MKTRTLAQACLASPEAAWSRRIQQISVLYPFHVRIGEQYPARKELRHHQAATPKTALSDTTTLTANTSASAVEPSAGSHAAAAATESKALGISAAILSTAGASTAATISSDAQPTASGRLGPTAAAASFQDLGVLELSSPVSSFSSSLELDSGDDVDGEMCTLVADPSGDVQVVCDSDPGHPLSLAEAAVYRPPFPPTLLQDMEAKLEADLTTVGVTILFAVGFISLEFGINDLIEHYFGDSLLSDVVCVWVGLAVVFWVRLSKMRLMRFDRWRKTRGSRFSLDGAPLLG